LRLHRGRRAQQGKAEGESEDFVFHKNYSLTG
jgi:hypothetical protein